MEKMQPEFEDETAVNPFDFWNGANFRLKVRKVAGFINYDKSEFEDASPVMDGDDAKLEELWKTQYSLSEFTSPSNFKTYDELKTKLENVLGGNVRFTETAEDANEESFTPEKSEESNSVGEDVDNDDALSYFEKLANES